MALVFCEDCKNFKQNECDYSGNKKKKKKWKEETEVPEYPPQILNRNNDCKWYED